ALQRTENNVTIRGYAGETVVISAPAGEGHFAYIAGSGWRIQDVTLRNFQPTNSGVVAFFNGSNNTLSNVVFDNCTTSGDTTSHCIYVAGSGGGHLISGCTVLRAAGAGVQFYHDPNSAGTVIQNSSFHSCDQAILIWAQCLATIKSNSFMANRI